MDWNLAQFAFIARWVIWPLLQPYVSQVEELTRLVRLARQDGASAAVLPAAVQQVNFSTIYGGEGSYIGRLDTISDLSQAQFLIRAQGGERITKFVLSATVDSTISVEVLRTTSARASAVSLCHSNHLAAGPRRDTREVSLDQRLSPGDCIVAVTRSPWAGVRVDGTLFFEAPK